MRQTLQYGMDLSATDWILFIFRIRQSGAEGLFTYQFRRASDTISEVCIPTFDINCK